MNDEFKAASLEKVNLSYVLSITDRMFEKPNFITDRKKPKESFTVLGKIFICKNKSLIPKDNEPLIAEIDASKHAPLNKCIELLLNDGFRELASDEIKELKLHFLSQPNSEEEINVEQFAEEVLC